MPQDPAQQTQVAGSREQARQRTEHCRQDNPDKPQEPEIKAESKKMGEVKTIDVVVTEKRDGYDEPGIGACV